VLRELRARGWVASLCVWWCLLLPPVALAVSCTPDIPVTVKETSGRTALTPSPSAPTITARPSASPKAGPDCGKSLSALNATRRSIIRIVNTAYKQASGTQTDAARAEPYRDAAGGLAVLQVRLEAVPELPALQLPRALVGRELARALEAVQGFARSYSPSGSRADYDAALTAYAEATHLDRTLSKELEAASCA
jgi:hypothetical protein